MLTFGADETLTEDTVILVVEPDYCLYREDAVAREEWREALHADGFALRDMKSLPVVLQDPTVVDDLEARKQVYEHNKKKFPSWSEHLWPHRDEVDEANLSEPASSSKAAPPGNFVRPSKKPKAAPKLNPDNAKHSNYEQERQVPVGKPEEKHPIGVADHHMRPELKDILAVLALASREKVGEFVWMGWDNIYHWHRKEPGQRRGRSQTPYAGAHFYAITAKGCRFLLKERIADEWWEMHMGRCFKHFLKKYQKLGHTHGFGACYLNPPMGNYFTHDTTTNANVREVPSHWGEPWVQGGTRKDPDDDWSVHRDLCWITESGPPEIITTFKPDDDICSWWCTRAAANFPREFLGPMHWHVWGHAPQDFGVLF